MKIAFLHALPFDERMWEPQLSEFDGHAPKLYPLGESFDYAGWRFEVVDLDGRRIDKILVTSLASPLASSRR